jgi:hypothetical protein
MWANKLMQQWDLFLESGRGTQECFFGGNGSKYFKRIDEDSYKNYRQVMQILDCALLDIQTVQYKPKILGCSIIYLIMGTSSSTQARSSESSVRRKSSTTSPGPPSSS